MNYNSVKTTKEFLDYLKYLYSAKQNKVTLISLPKRKYLTFDGKGEPASKLFQEAIQSLYSTAYTLKMGLKYKKLEKPKGYFDYKVPTLEGLWWFSKGKFKMGANLKKIFWKLIIMTPSFITKELFDVAQNQALEKKQDLPIKKVKLEIFEAKKAIQTLHIGPYNKEEAAVEALHKYAKENGLKIAGYHHEIYISDPGRTPQAKLKTVVRYPVV